MSEWRRTGILTRRRALSAVSAAGLAGLPVVGACSPAAGTKPAGTPAALRRYDGTVLQHWGSYGAAERDALLKFYDRFVEEQAPGLKVEIQTVTNAEYLSKLTAAIVGGAAPDSCRFKENLNYDMAARKNTVALDGYLAKDTRVKLADFTPQSVEALRYKEKPHGVPYYHQYVILGWNKELFRQAGLDADKPPETWQDLREAARRLTQPQKEQWGFRLYEFGPPPREQIFNWFMEWVWRNGGEVWNRDRTRALVDSPEAIQAMQTMVDMIYADRSTIPPDQPQIGVETGRLGMWMPTAVGVLNLRRTQPDLDFGLGPMPKNRQFATQLQTNSLALMAGARQLDVAWSAISYISREDVMYAWQTDPQLSAVPVRRSLLDKAPWTEASSGWKPIVDVLKMPGNRAKPHIPDWDAYTEQNIVPFLTEAWRQQKTPKDALTEAARQANTWLTARPKEG
ncbi:MAG TPA: extracellular solute-binding protein [Chloroflexota bacterium]|nr:extracellular solute-binding protein [Chloroflexota bacterium]